MNVLIAVLVVLALSGILAGTLGNKFKASKQKSQTPNPDKGKVSEGMLNTLRGKTQSVTQHITWKNGFAAFGALSLALSLMGWVSNSEDIIVVDNTHTLSELCVGQTYHAVFKKGEEEKVKIVLDSGYTFETIDLRILYGKPEKGKERIEYRVGRDGNSLIDKQGNVTQYTLQGALGELFFGIKIGENGIHKVPSGTILVEMTHLDKQLNGKSES